MSDQEFAVTFSLLAESFAVKDLTEVRIEAYKRSLADVPGSVFNHAVTAAIKQAKFFPRVAELREYCEKARVEMRSAIKFPNPPCEGCSADGFTELIVGNVHRMVRCNCWRMTQAKVLALGVGSEPLALPEADFSRIGE
jgi:hypothetical protein